MTELRWILLAIGIAVIGGVYWWSRRDGTGAARKQTGRVEPRLDGAAEPQVAQPPRATRPDDEVSVADTPPPSPQVTSLDDVRAASGDQLTIPMPGEAHDDLAEAPEPAVPDRVIKLHVVARDDNHFVAADIVGALRAEGLRFAHHELFHKFSGEGNPGPDEAPLFSVSDMLKPGTFDLETLAETRLQGVSLFMALPNPGDAVAVFAEMLATGRRLAATFGGLLVDERGCAVSRQSASHMREDIINYQLEARKAGDVAE